MAKVWSFNTTLRNPERLENMLRVLSEMEGEPFDEEGQRKFFGLQIQKRLYKPTKKTLKETDLIAAVYDDKSGEDIDNIIIERILHKSKDAALRGRAAAGALNRFGLCVALKSKGVIIITELGNRWLNHDIDDEELFTRFFLKWQYPNPIEKTGYAEFNIKPIVGTLAVIKGVNDAWSSLGNKPVGLDKEEYQLFIPSLTRAEDIPNVIKSIVEYRTKKESKTGMDKSNFKKVFSSARAREIFDDKKLITKALRDLRDYQDSSIRYIRISGLIVLRGGDTHIDIAPDKHVEVESILSNISAEATNVGTFEEYLMLLNDTQTQSLPWENENDVERITQQFFAFLKEHEIDSDSYIQKIQEFTGKKRMQVIDEYINNIRISKLMNIKHDISALDECIEQIENIGTDRYKPLTARPSLDLEWYVSRALMILNDAVKIVPSYNLGDDGIPTGFRANLPDISCYYDSFAMTTEVTLLTGRNQSYAEEQPVMRHLRDFEDTVLDRPSYCIFIAPHIHRDALNSFWSSNINGYEERGRIQRIVPVTIPQFLRILKIARVMIQNKTLNHMVFKKLLDSLLDQAERVTKSQSWLDSFPEIIENWTA